MPHFTMEYSTNLEKSVDIPALCKVVHKTIMSTGLFELCALRVRALRADAYAVADLLLENAFIDMSFRIGKGRSELEKRNTGEAIFSTVTRTLAALFDSPTLRCRSKSERAIWISAGRRTPPIRGCGDEQTGDSLSRGRRCGCTEKMHARRFGEFVVPAHKSPEDLLDQFGLMASVMMLCIGLLIAALWAVDSPSLRNVVRSKM